MTSTYSSSLRLELIGTGDQTGTWGTTTNTNLGTLLEQAITGVLSVAQGDTTLTLTSSNGASDQARNAVIDLTGAMTAGRDVIVPTANKLYLAKNSTTGGFAVTVKTAAGSGVAIAAGTSQWVYCDGTNVVAGIVGTLASQVASAVAITGGTISGLTTLGASAAAITGGTITGLTALTLASGSARPATNDAAALGTSALSWSDLFLASGAVINWANGDYTITHSAGLLTTNGNLSLTTSGVLTAGTIELGAASDTTISRSAAGVIAVEGVPLYPNVPQNPQSTAYTTVLADAQKQILHPAADNNARTFTIAANASVAYPTGTAITFINEINTVTIAINSDTLVLAGPGTTGSRTLAANGVATAIKITSTKWMIFGAGLT
jgi:hypothetical protein